jgi:hypothetical protein
VAAQQDPTVSGWEFLGIGAILAIGDGRIRLGVA